MSPSHSAGANILSKLAPRTAWDDIQELNSPHGSELKKALAVSINQAVAEKELIMQLAIQAQQQAKLSEAEIIQWMEKASKPDVRQTLSAGAIATLNSVPKQIQSLFKSISEAVERLATLAAKLIALANHQPSILNYVEIAEKQKAEDAVVFDTVLDTVLPDLAPEEKAVLQENFAAQQEKTVNIIEREARFLASQQKADAVNNVSAPKPDPRKERDVVLSYVLQQEFFLLFRLKELLAHKAQKEGKPISDLRLTLDASKLLKLTYNSITVKNKVAELEKVYTNHDSILLIHELNGNRAEQGIMYTLDAARQVHAEIAAEKYIIQQALQTLGLMGVQISALAAEVTYNPNIAAARGNFSSPSAIPTPRPTAATDSKEGVHNPRSPFTIPTLTRDRREQ